MAYTTIDNPELYFQIKTYTGTGSSQAHTFDGSEDMQPDFLWIKSRSNNANPGLFDSVRGTTKLLSSPSTDAETTISSELTSFDSDGFTLGSGGGGYTNQNSGRTYVAWGWKAGGSASSNSNGSITSSVSANTTAGFSIVSYTGTGSNATIGHGLGSVPAWIITKGRDTAGNNWAVYHHKNTSAPETEYLALNGTNATVDQANYWNDTAPTSSVFTVGSQVDTNKGSEAMIAYCWAEIKGFSKFGSYTGNASTNGPYIHTGFRPSYVIIKNTSTSNDWFTIDIKRDTLGPNNPVGRKSLEANDSAAEVTRTTKDMDFLSNGIKLRTADGTQNNSGENYVYMAFAENPFVNSNGVPNNAK